VTSHRSGLRPGRREQTDGTPERADPPPCGQHAGKLGDDLNRGRRGLRLDVHGAAVVDAQQAGQGVVEIPLGRARGEPVRRGGVDEVDALCGLGREHGQHHVEGRQGAVVLTLGPSAAAEVGGVVGLHHPPVHTGQEIVPLCRRSGIVALGGERGDGLGGVIAGEVIALRMVTGETALLEGVEPAIDGAVDAGTVSGRHGVIEPVVADRHAKPVEAYAVALVTKRRHRVRVALGGAHVDEDVDALGPIEDGTGRVEGLGDAEAESEIGNGREVVAALVAFTDTVGIRVVVAIRPFDVAQQVGLALLA
jgi:hypothetical protein